MFTRFLFLLCRLKSNLQFACAKFAWMRCWCCSCCSCCCFIFAIKIVCHLCAKWQLNFVSMQRCVCMCGCVFVWVVWGLELCAKLAYLTFQWANICTNTNTKTCKVCFTHRSCVFSYVCVWVWVSVYRVYVCAWVPEMASCQSKNGSLSTRTSASAAALLFSTLAAYLFICACQLISVQVAIKTIIAALRRPHPHTPLALTHTHTHTHILMWQASFLWDAINSSQLVVRARPFNKNDWIQVK